MHACVQFPRLSNSATGFFPSRLLRLSGPRLATHRTPHVCSPPSLSAGLTSSKAAQLFERAEQQLGVAAPAPELSQTHLQPYLQAASAAGITVSQHPPDPSNAPPRDPTIWPNIVTADSAGRRRDAYAAYVAPALAGPCAHNLNVVQSAAAARVIVTDGRAVAVEFVQTDAPPPQRVWRAGARVGVLLCAGPHGSPQLLQLSGLGPGGLLRMHGINVIRDLPVGLNSIVRLPTPQLRPPPGCSTHPSISALDF